MELGFLSPAPAWSFPLEASAAISKPEECLSPVPVLPPVFLSVKGTLIFCWEMQSEPEVSPNFSQAAFLKKSVDSFLPRPSSPSCKFWLFSGPAFGFCLNAGSLIDLH